MASFGKIEEFNEIEGDFECYLERLEHYFKANKVKEDDKCSVFLTLLGPKTYAVLKNLCVPDKPGSKTYVELAEILLRHFAPKRIIIAERVKFLRRKQHKGERIADYAVVLQKLSMSCDYKQFLDEALRDAFVSGLMNEEIVQKLLVEENLTFKRALERALIMEAAVTQSKELRPGHFPQEDNDLDGKDVTYAIVKGRPTGSRERYKGIKNDAGQGVAKVCYRCQSVSYLAAQCPYANYVCKSCHKKGHLQRACRAREVNYVPRTEEQSSEGFDLLNIDFSECQNRQRELTVDVCLNGQKERMVIDTAAVVSVCSDKVYQQKLKGLPLQKAAISLKTYSGEPLTVLGQCVVPVVYLDQQASLPMIVIKGKGTRSPTLLGRNWLSHLQLDWASIFKKQLGVDQTCYVKQIGGGCPNREQRIQELKTKYGSVFHGNLGVIKGSVAQVVIKEEAVPVFCKARPVPFAMRTAVEEELHHLVSSGVLYPVTKSDWATPLVCVRKKGRGVRLCADFKVTLNPVVELDHYPLPTPSEIFTLLAGGKVFSVIYLCSAYTQLAVSEKSQPLLTINTHKGLYRFSRLPFGLCSAPSIFQMTIDQILKGVPGVVAYLDDILIVGTSLDDAHHKLEAVLGRLKAHNISVREEKCKLLCKSVVYLGHKVDAEGLHPTEEKTRAIQEAPAPKDVTELRSYLGLLQFYGRFLQSSASALHPLHELLKKDHTWKWTQDCEEAFLESKHMLLHSPALIPYDPQLPILVTGDASAYGVGAVLAHRMPSGEERPIAFASKTLTKTEMAYSQVEREALALVFAVRKFHCYLYGRRFTLITDHQALVTLFGSKKGTPVMAAARIQRWSLILSAYQYVVQYRKGTDISHADGLSRLPRPVMEEETMEFAVEEGPVFFFSPFDELPLTAQDVAKATHQDPILSQARDQILHGWSNCVSEELRPFARRKLELSVEQDCVLWGCRVVVPTKLRKSVLELLHEEHPGITRMKLLARSYVWWPKMEAQIEEQVHQCEICQQMQTATPVVPLHPWSWPARRWQRVHLDFAEQGNSKFLLLVDAYSKWVEIFPMQSTTAVHTTARLRTVFAQFGLPEMVVTDNGPPFQSEEFGKFLTQNGIRHIRTPPYHPQSNGAAERQVQTVKVAMLQQLLSGPSYQSRTLQHRLDVFLFAYRNTPHSLTKKTPAELFLQCRPRTRLSLLKPSLLRSMENQQVELKTRHDLRRGTYRGFLPNEQVWVRTTRGEDNRWVEGMVVKVLGAVTYQVTMKRGIKVVHADHLRKRDGVNKGLGQQQGNTNPPVRIDTGTEGREGEIRQPVKQLEAEGGSASKAARDVEGGTATKGAREGDMEREAAIGQEGSPVVEKRFQIPGDPGVSKESSEAFKGFPLLRRSARCAKAPRRLDL